MLQRVHSGDGCILASTLCKYTLRKGGLFVLSWAMVQQVRRESISSDLLMCGGGVHIILLLPLVARCLDPIDVCIWRMFVFMSVVVRVCGLFECFCVAAIVKDSRFLSLGVLKYVVFFCKGCDVMDVLFSAFSTQHILHAVELSHRSGKLGPSNGKTMLSMCVCVWVAVV